jgi:hypothetical protein
MPLTPSLLLRRRHTHESLRVRDEKESETRESYDTIQHHPQATRQSQSFACRAPTSPASHIAKQQTGSRKIMTPLPSRRWVLLLLFLPLAVVARTRHTAAAAAPRRLRSTTRSPPQAETATQRRSLAAATSVDDDEGLVLYNGDPEEEERQGDDNGEKVVASPEEAKEAPAVASRAEQGDSVSPNDASPRATPAAEVLQEEPLMGQDEGGASSAFLRRTISLSLLAQRCLSLAAALLGMIWTAYSMSEHPDGLYAQLCRSILAVVRGLGRILTCKSCGCGNHRNHIPVATMEYGFQQ